MRALVAGWIGSTNLGDELVFAGLRRHLAARGVEVTAIAVDPLRTIEDHGVRTADHDDPAGIWGAVGRADVLVFGGGGLLQDETSPFNLPYHLARVWAGRLRHIPWAGVGLGAGPLRTVLGRRLVAASLGSATALSVRDNHSARLLEGLRIRDVTEAADLALALPEPAVEVEDTATVCLRPWSGAGGLLPVSVRARRDPTPEWFVPAAAAALDRLAKESGLRIRLVALQADRDGPLHDEVAARMDAAVTVARPGLEDVVAEIARGRIVVSMRYHGGIAAVLGGRPAVLLGYSPKVDALADELGAGAVGLGWSPDDLHRLVEAASALLGDPRAEEAVAGARARLQERERRNGEVIDRLLDAASR
ncbi:MAG: polysaccharide pyruvyl transferase family protein [Nitriliruptorales bacterium]